MTLFRTRIGYGISVVGVIMLALIPLSCSWRDVSYTPSGPIAAVDTLDQGAAKPIPARYSLRVYGSTIVVDLPTTCLVQLEILNATGDKVRMLVDAEYEPASESFNWDGKNDAGQAVKEGFYIVSLQAGSFSAQLMIYLAEKKVTGS